MCNLANNEINLSKLQQISPFLFYVLKKELHAEKTKSKRGYKGINDYTNHLPEFINRTLKQLEDLKSNPFLSFINHSNTEIAHLAEICASSNIIKSKNEHSPMIENVLARIPVNKISSRRMSSPRWWETRLSRQINQIKEHLLISLGMVQAKKSLYISNETIMLREKDIRERVSFLSIRKVVNAETQEEKDTLLHMAMSGIANPRIQKSELTQILFGTYKYALQHKHVCRFITITLPKSFHATTINGTPCSGWKGLTPKQAHDHLQGAWTKARSALSEIACYGTRFVEPHHDSTPHWHILVYIPQENDSKVISTINKYFSTIVDSSSFDSKIDMKLFTNEAVLHYMMKFLASSFPGVADENAINDKTGKPISCEAKNAKLWASQWGIRRFQHFGLPEIGAWRECRKVRSHNITHELGHAAEAVRHAADHGDFQGYIEAQGGIGIKRS